MFKITFKELDFKVIFYNIYLYHRRKG